VLVDVCVNVAVRLGVLVAGGEVGVYVTVGNSMIVGMATNEGDEALHPIRQHVIRNPKNVRKSKILSSTEKRFSG